MLSLSMAKLLENLNKENALNNIKVAQLITRHMKPRWPKPVRYIGGGSYGRVYETSDGRLMKFIRGNHPVEYEALKNLQHTHVVPHFRNGNSFIMNMRPIRKFVSQYMFRKNIREDNLTVFMMSKVGGPNPITFRQYMNKYTTNQKLYEKKLEEARGRIKNIMGKLYLHGWSHSNLHDQNLIVQLNSNGNIVRMWAIDFGMAKKIKKENTNIPENNRNLAALYGFTANNFRRIQGIRAH